MLFYMGGGSGGFFFFFFSPPDGKGRNGLGLPPSFSLSHAEHREDKRPLDATFLPFLVPLPLSSGVPAAVDEKSSLPYPSLLPFLRFGGKEVGPWDAGGFSPGMSPFFFRN